MQRGKPYIANSKKYKKKRPLLGLKDRRLSEQNISRLIDVRLWNMTEIRDFLAVCVDGKYFDIFTAQNLKGKRLEYITTELLTYCNIPMQAAQKIVVCRDFFIDWLSIYVCLHCNQIYFSFVLQSADCARI